MLSNEKNRESWNEIVIQWEKSNTIASEWCKDNGIHYRQFIYHRACINNKKKNPESLSSNSFIEFTTQSRKGIEIEFQGLVIKVPSNFDVATLHSVLKLLINISC